MHKTINKPGLAKRDNEEPRDVTRFSKRPGVML